MPVAAYFGARLLVAASLSPQAMKRLDEKPGSCPQPATGNWPVPNFSHDRRELPLKLRVPARQRRLTGTLAYSHCRPVAACLGVDAHYRYRLDAAVQILALTVCGDRYLTLPAFWVRCPLSCKPDLHRRSIG